MRARESRQRSATHNHVLALRGAHRAKGNVVSFVIDDVGIRSVLDHDFNGDWCNTLEREEETREEP